jgi:hypothetical protein
VVCYLHDKPIYSTDKKEQESQERQVLQQLGEFRLYCKAKKCQFEISEVSCRGFVFTPEGVGMD